METTPETQETETNQLVVAAHKRFCRHLLLLTVKDACDLRRWYDTGDYRGGERGDYYFRFGFNKRAKPEPTFKRISSRIRRWICGDFFVTCCKVSKVDPDNARAIIHQILIGKAEYDRVSAYLQELEEVTENYAVPRGVKREKDPEAESIQAQECA